MSGSPVEASPATGPATDAARGMRPLRSRYVLAALLVLVAVGAVLMWGLLGVDATDETAQNFPREDLPGELTLDLHPGGWDVYAEGPATVEAVTVTYGDGRPVEVTRTDGGGAAYDHHGLTAERVASFELPLGGEWEGVRVRVEGAADDPDVTFAVAAADELDYIGLQPWGMITLLIVNVGAAIAVVAVPIVRHRRHRPG